MPHFVEDINSELDAYLRRHANAPIMSVYRVALAMGYRGEDIRMAMIRFCRTSK